MVQAESDPTLVQVILLKTKSLPVDAYEEFFNSALDVKYEPTFVPVLEHKFNIASLKKLEQIILDGSFAHNSQKISSLTKYGGLIFTSQRAVEAFCDIIERLRKIDIGIDHLIAHDLALYVVGPATARGIRALQLECPVLGEETGNGEALAAFILDHHRKYRSKTEWNHKNLPLLFLVGEKRRDIIPKTLQASTLPEAERIQVDEMVIYETGLMGSFPNDLAALNSDGLPHNRLQWFVIFSPTGCGAMFEAIGMLDPATGKVKVQHSPSKRRIFIAAIGPTTRDYLIREFGFEPDVCAAAPSPDGIGTAIREYISAHKL